MRIWTGVLTLLALAAPIPASALAPFAPYDISRGPAETVQAAKAAGNYGLLVEELSAMGGIRPAEVDRRLTDHAWRLAQTCPDCVYLFAGVGKGGRVGYRPRELRTGEDLWCISPNACFSAYCANPTKIQGAVVRRSFCAPGYVQYSTDYFESPGAFAGAGAFAGSNGAYAGAFGFSGYGGTGFSTTASHHQGWKCVFGNQQ